MGAMDAHASSLTSSHETDQSMPSPAIDSNQRVSDCVSDCVKEQFYLL